MLHWHKGPSMHMQRDILTVTALCWRNLHRQKFVLYTCPQLTTYRPNFRKGIVHFPFLSCLHFLSFGQDQRPKPEMLSAFCEIILSLGLHRPRPQKQNCQKYCERGYYWKQEVPEISKESLFFRDFHPSFAGQRSSGTLHTVLDKNKEGRSWLGTST